jgi:hypothetical protein
MPAGMAQIRIVDDWLRSPAAAPSHYRSVMVIAEKWAEQRVLMRAYAESRDQLRPTIVLHGVELAIGPAGIDTNGPWGIHIGDQDDAQSHGVKSALEESARRLAGSKGNPPRLVDEAATFDREPTGNWGPGAPRIVPQRTGDTRPAISIVAPAAAARIPRHAAAFTPQTQTAVHSPVMPSNPEHRLAPLPRTRGSQTRPPPLSVRTALGYASGSGAQSAIIALGLSPQVSARLGRYVDRVVPTHFAIDASQRRAIDVIGLHETVTAHTLGQLLGVVDPVAFMEDLVHKLEAFGLGDLFEPARPMGGEPAYRLRW